VTTPIIEADGTDGGIRVYDEYVEVVNSRFLEFLRSSEAKLTIPRENIGQISFRDAGRLRPGIIKIFPTGVEDNDININTEPYTVRFTHTNREVFNDIHTVLQPGV